MISVATGNAENVSETEGDRKEKEKKIFTWIKRWTGTTKDGARTTLTRWIVEGWGGVFISIQTRFFPRKTNTPSSSIHAILRLVARKSRGEKRDSSESIVLSMILNFYRSAISILSQAAFFFYTSFFLLSDKSSKLLSRDTLVTFITNYI